VTETGCQLTPKFGTLFATIKEEGGEIYEKGRPKKLLNRSEMDHHLSPPAQSQGRDRRPTRCLQRPVHSTDQKSTVVIIHPTYRPYGEKGGEIMAAINYLSEFDKIKAYQTYRPIVEDLSKPQLEILILLLINGSELDYAVDLAMSYPKEG